MKILEVIPELNSGGAEVFLVNLSNKLAEKENTDVTILTLFPINEEHFLIKKISPLIKLISFKKRRGIDLKMIYQIYKLIKKEQYDIAHFHVNAIAYCILSALIYRKCKYYATIHSDAYKEAQGIHRFIRRYMFDKNLMVPITISNESDKSFKELYKKEAKLIYNGVPKYEKSIDVDLNAFKTTNKTKVFVNVASIQPLKNQLAMARVFNCLVNEGRDIVLLIIGRTTELYKECADELKKEISNNVHLLGEISNPRDYMVKADYFILASHYEGMPITLLESISVGCIPVITAVGGNIDVVRDKYNGYLISDSSEESIYLKVKQILEADKEETLQIRKGLEDCREAYTIEHCADMYMEIFV